MKRKICDTNTIPESSTPSPIPTSIHRVRVPVTRPESRSIQADGPKTSEYAFFKKLKKNVGQRFGSQLKQREKNVSIKVNSGECGRVGESTSIIRDRSKEFRSPLSVGNVSSKGLDSLLSIKNARCEASGSPLPINHVMHCNFDSFVSPVDTTDNNPDINLKRAVSAVENTCSIDYFLEQDKVYRRQEGSQSDKPEFFSRKRQKLSEWAYSSFPEIDKLCFKGYDLISMLLNRLLPWSNEEKNCKSTKPVLVESNSKIEFLTCSKSDGSSNQPYRMPLKDIMDVDYAPYFENSTSSYSNGKTELRTCSKFDVPPNKPYRTPLTDIMDADYLPYSANSTLSYWSGRSSEAMVSNCFCPTYNNHRSFKNNLEFPSRKLRGEKSTSYIEENSTLGGFPFVRHGSFLPFSPFKEPDEYYDLLLNKRIPANLELPSCKLRGENLISCIEENSTFGFPFVKHEPFPFNPFKEPDEYYCPNRCLPGTEPQLLLLDCDSVNLNERSLSATRQNSNWAIIPAGQNSWDPQQNLNDCSESSAMVGLCPLPSLGKYSQNFYSLMPPSSSVYDKHEFGRTLIEVVAERNHPPFTSSLSPDAFNLIAGRNSYEVVCKDSETNYIFPSPRNHLGFLGEAFGEENSASFTEPRLSFALDIECKHFQPSGYRRYPCSSTSTGLRFLGKEMMHSSFLGEEEFGSSSGGLSCRSFIHFSDDNADIHGSKSFYFQVYQDKDKAHPFLDDDSNWEERTKVYVCDNEANLFE